MFKISPRIQTFVSKVFSFLSINFCVFLFLLSDINFFVKGESTNLLYVPRRTVQQAAGAITAHTTRDDDGTEGTVRAAPDPSTYTH